MRTDAYTKIILTVIAICLTFNVLKEIEIIPDAKASTSSILTNTNSTIDVNIVSCSSYATLPVKVESWKASTLPVEIKSWSGAIPVKVESWRAGKLDVNTR